MKWSSWRLRGWRENWIIILATCYKSRKLSIEVEILFHSKVRKRMKKRIFNCNRRSSSWTFESWTIFANPVGQLIRILFKVSQLPSYESFRGGLVRLKVTIEGGIQRNGRFRVRIIMTLRKWIHRVNGEFNLVVNDYQEWRIFRDGVAKRRHRHAHVEELCVFVRLQLPLLLLIGLLIWGSESATDRLGLIDIVLCSTVVVMWFWWRRWRWHTLQIVRHRVKGWKRGRTRL